MARNDMHRGCEITVRDGDAVIGRYRKSTGDSRHNFIGNIVLNEQLQFLPAAAEQEGITALEAHDPFPGKRLLQKRPVNLFLGHPVIACPLADIDRFRLVRNQRPHSIADESVIDDNFCVLKDFKSLNCK